MRTNSLFDVIAGVILGVTVLVSCETEALLPPVVDNIVLPLGKASMRLDCGLPSYGTSTKGEGIEGEWPDSSKVYLQFEVGDKYVSGSATYDLEEDIWSVEYAGTLLTVESARCQAYYFENAGEATFEEVPMTEKTAVYQDTTATYSFSFEDNLIILKGKLKPYLSRVRLEGKYKQGYNFDGPLHYTSYSMLDNKFVSSSKMICDTIPESGKTDYYYLFFEDQNNKQMSFYDYVKGDKFTRTFPENVFVMGKSGYINAPTAEAYSGWEAEKLYKDIKVYDTSIRVIRVEPGTFMMGQVTSTQSSSMPVHKVSLTKPFYVSETEITNDVYKSVMGSTPSRYTHYRKPVQNVSWTGCNSFIQALNKHTALNFRLPTEAEWEFVARGGNMSKGYVKYSGANSYSDVAVFSGSSSSSVTSDSDKGPAFVASKKPNELGVYDMSGNVAEWCWDRYASYSEGYVINPVGSNSGNDRVYRGGSWYYDNDYIYERFYEAESHTYQGLGFRVVIDAEDLENY